jgi:hypothetical protein
MGRVLCRIGSGTKPDDRRDKMQIFQNAGDALEDASKFFLLSGYPIGQTKPVLIFHETKNSATRR